MKLLALTQYRWILILLTCFSLLAAHLIYSSKFSLRSLLRHQYTERRRQWKPYLQIDFAAFFSSLSSLIQLNQLVKNSRILPELNYQNRIQVQKEKEMKRATLRCYTRWFAMRISSASQRCNIAATLSKTVATLFQHCLPKDRGWKSCHVTPPKMTYQDTSKERS